MPFKRSEWNDLVDEVNAIITNPTGSSCPAQLPVEQIPPGKWRRSHISTVQDRIKATCPEITFEEIKRKWRRRTLTEIREKLEQAWCNCTDDCVPVEEGGHYANVYFLYIPAVAHLNTIPFEDIAITTDISGMVIGPPGFPNYDYCIQVQRVPPGESADDAGEWDNVTCCFVNCDGKPTEPCAEGGFVRIPAAFLWYEDLPGSLAYAEEQAAAYGGDMYRFNVTYGPMGCPNLCGQP